MLSKEGMDFILHVTHWFGGHWEDPEWGRRPATQVLVAMAIHEFAAGIQDADLRGQISSAADRVIAKNSQAIK